MSNRSHDIRYALRMLANNKGTFGPMPRARARIATADRFGWVRRITPESGALLNRTLGLTRIRRSADFDPLVNSEEK